MAATWQPNTVYAPGAVVVPTSGSGQTVVQVAITNAGFEDDLTSWTADTGWSASTSAHYEGSKAAALAGNAGDDVKIINDVRSPVVVGQRISATCMVQQGASDSGDAGGCVALFWFDADDAQISSSNGNSVTSGSGGEWHRSSVNGVAPVGAVTVSIGAICFSHSDAMYIDAFQWDYAYTAPVAPLTYTAVQAEPGHSGATEPDWPNETGVSVQDNEVIWVCGGVDRITWECSPLMKSGDTEPTFPEAPGAEVLDNTVNWKCITPQITDPNCPQSKIVALAATKVFIADNDIVRFSATADPTDWTTTNDAGFLPFGLQNFGANPAAAMNLYRSNLVVFNTEGCQMWQVDEDPANMTLLDAVPLGSTQQRAMSPVSNDLFLLTPLGVRTMGIAAGSQNLMAGDVGMPIDPLVKDALDSATEAGIAPIATYYPAAGQYWIAFPDYPNEGFFLTSRPYPIDVVEAMQISGELLQEYLLSPVEALDLAATLVSIDLHGTYDSYAMEAEALSTVAELVSVELRNILHSYAVPTEALDLSASLVSINLHQSRVFTSMDPEAVDLTATLLSIDLVGA